MVHQGVMVLFILKGGGTKFNPQWMVVFKEKRE